MQEMQESITLHESSSGTGDSYPSMMWNKLHHGGNPTQLSILSRIYQSLSKALNGVLFLNPPHLHFGGPG